MSQYIPVQDHNYCCGRKNFVSSKCLLLVMMLTMVWLVVDMLVVHAATVWNLAPLGSPRIIFRDTVYASKLRADMSKPTRAASAFKSFVDSGVTTGGSQTGTIYEFRAWHAALMSRVTGQSSYCTFAVNDADAFVKSEEALIANGEKPVVAYDSYLEVGAHVGNVMMVYDWCRAQTSSSQRSRWVAYVNQAVSNVWNCTTAKWGNRLEPWSCWSVNDPANNYYYSFIRATMMVGLATFGENPLADMWLQQFRNVKLGKELIPYFNKELVSGGSLEGTGYGTSHKELFTLYDWWQRSTGENIANLMPHTYNSLQWILHQMVPTLDYLAPIGDHARESTAAFYDYHRHYILVLCSLYPTSPLARVAKTILSKSSVPQMTGGFNTYADFMFDINHVVAAPLNDTQLLTTSFRGDSTGILATRSSWESDAVYAQLMCGPYTQSHAHRDQGSLLLYKKGWLAIDENINTHSGIQQGEAFHNMVRIDVAGQTLPQRLDTSCQMSALSDSSVYTYALAKVTPSYGGHPAVKKVEREFLFIKPSTFVVMDRVVTTTAFNAKRVYMMNFASAPTSSGSSITVNNGKSSMTMTTLSPWSQARNNFDWASIESDANSGVRVDIVDGSSQASTSNATHFLNVMSVDGSVIVATRESDSNGMMVARLSLADGRSVLVRFSKDGTGGSLRIVKSGVVQLDENFTNGKQVLGVVQSSGIAVRRKEKQHVVNDSVSDKYVHGWVKQVLIMMLVVVLLVKL